MQEVVGAAPTRSTISQTEANIVLLWRRLRDRTPTAFGLVTRSVRARLQSLRFRGHSTMAVRLIANQQMRVQFPLSASLRGVAQW